jgi:hypothetical protein
MNEKERKDWYLMRNLSIVIHNLALSQARS